MMTDDRQNDDAALEALFEHARATPPQVPAALTSRVLADARAAQPVPRRRGWRALVHAIGGVPALGGLVSATVVGFWLGVAPPEAIPDLAGQLWLATDSATALDTADAQDMATFGWDIEEG